MAQPRAAAVGVEAIGFKIHLERKPMGPASGWVHPSHTLRTATAGEAPSQPSVQGQGSKDY